MQAPPTCPYAPTGCCACSHYRYLARKWGAALRVVAAGCMSEADNMALDELKEEK